MEIFNSVTGKIDETIPSLCYIGCKLNNPVDFQYINLWSFSTLPPVKGNTLNRDNNNNNVTDATLNRLKGVFAIGADNKCNNNTHCRNHQRCHHNHGNNNHNNHHRCHHHHHQHHQYHAMGNDDNDVLGRHLISPVKKYTQNCDERAQYVTLKVPIANRNLLRARTFYLWTYQISTILFVDVVTQRIYNFMATPSCQQVFCYMAIDIESKLIPGPMNVVAAATKSITKITNTVRLVSSDRQCHTLLKYQIPLISENIEFFSKFPSQRAYAWNAHVRYDLAKPHNACNFTIYAIPGECLMYFKCFSPEITTRQFNKCTNLLDTYYHKPSIATNAAVFECLNETFEDKRLRSNPMPVYLGEFFTIVAVRETLQKYHLNSMTMPPAIKAPTSLPNINRRPDNDACNFGGGINNRYMDTYTAPVYRMDHCPSAEVSFYVRYRNRIHVATKEINLVDIYVRRHSVLALVKHKPQIDYFTSAWDRNGKALCDEFTSNLALLDVKINNDSVPMEDESLDHDATKDGERDKSLLEKSPPVALTSTLVVDGTLDDNDNEESGKNYDDAVNVDNLQKKLYHVPEH